MIRILYVHHGSGIGGAPLSLLYLLRGLDRSRFLPTVLCIHESVASELFRSEGFETLVFEDIKDFSHTNVLWYPWWQAPKIVARALHLPFAIARIRKFLRSRPFDLVHLNTSTLIAFGIAAKREGVKVVWHIREPLSRGYFGIRRAFVRSVIARNANVIIPICRFDADQLLPGDNIHVVYNFVDFSVFDSSISGGGVRQELGIQPETPLVLMLGGVNRIKGTLEFTRAAARLLSRGSDACFLIAGPVPERSARNLLNGRGVYRRHVEQSIPADMNKRIRFLGVRKDVPQLIAAASIVCFPSTVAHFARPIIEASAMARPVVASDLGGPRELVRDGETGTLVPPGDDRALADAIADLLERPEKAEAFGTAGRDLARRLFDARTNTRAIIDLYDRLLLPTS